MAASDKDTSIQSVSKEAPLFEPPQAFRERATISSRDEYEALHRQSVEHPDAFWREQARILDWFKPPTQTLKGALPHATWFEDGTLNVSFNCLDRHVQGARKDMPTIVWEGEPGDQRVLS